MHYRVVDANVAWRVADKEAVLLHADSSAYFGLNQTGTLLWALLAERPLTLDQLTTWARSRFPDAPADLPSEIAAFVDRLVEHDLLESTEAAESSAPPAAAGEETPTWEAPAVERFGELEKLILSGE
jgi:hypothetical protein